MAEVARATTTSPQLIATLNLIVAAQIPIPPDVQKDLLVIFSMSSMIALFVGSGSRDDKEAVIENLKWVDEASLEQEPEPGSDDDDEDADTIAMGPLSETHFNPLEPKLRTLSMPLDGRVEFLMDVLEHHILPACVGRGKESCNALLGVCTSLEALAEKHLTILAARPACLTDLINLLRTMQGVVNPLPKPHHFTSLLSALHAHQTKQAGREHDVFSGLLLKGWFRERTLYIAKHSADMKHAIESMESHRALMSRMPPFAQNSSDFLNGFRSSLDALKSAYVSLLPGATTTFETCLVEMIRLAMVDMQENKVDRWMFRWGLTAGCF